MTLPELPLRDLDVGAFKVVKETVAWFGGQDHTRWVFRVPRRLAVLTKGAAYYAKLWNSTYIRRDNLLRALDRGFYDEQTTPALAALIVHHGMCRGYLTVACGPAYLRDPVFERSIRERTRATGLFNVQFSPYHVMKLGRRSTLIDLEGVYEVHDAARMSEFHCRFDDAAYEAFVNALARGQRAEVMGDSALAVSRPPIGRVLWRAISHPVATTQAVIERNRYRFASPSSLPHHVHLLER